jgi:hypothetical protein
VARPRGILIARFPGAISIHQLKLQKLSGKRGFISSSLVGRWVAVDVIIITLKEKRFRIRPASKPKVLVNRYRDETVPQPLECKRQFRPCPWMGCFSIDPRQGNRIRVSPILSGAIEALSSGRRTGSIQTPVGAAVDPA